MAPDRAALQLFVSLKMYFGHQQTVDWVNDIAGIVAARRSARGEDAAPRIVILPSFTTLVAVAPIVQGEGILLGAQDVAPSADGAQTGEVSAAQLVELGCTYVEIGHAERRSLFGEADELIAAKVLNATRHGLVPLICVGETDRHTRSAAIQECREQLAAAMSRLADEGLRTSVVIAYEPVWAIGQAAPADPEDIVAIADAIRQSASAHPAVASAEILYGGSAGEEVARRLRGRVDGLFLGRFAHDPQAFTRILDAAGPADRHIGGG